MQVNRSIFAILAGFVATFALSYGSDFLMESAGVIPKDNLYVEWYIVAFVIFYRNLFNVFGSFLVGIIAKYKPMIHSLAIGTIGFIGSTKAAKVTWKMKVGPHWYTVSIALLALPSAWLGGKLAEGQIRRRGVKS